MQPLAAKSANPAPAKKTAPARPAAGFQRLGSVLKQHAVEKPVNSAGAPKTDGACVPKVQPIVVKGVVQRLIVTCSCGQTIEIDCQYGVD